MITMLRHFVKCSLSLPPYLTNHNYTYTLYHNQQAGSASSNFITSLMTVWLDYHSELMMIIIWNRKQNHDGKFCPDQSQILHEQLDIFKGEDFSCCASHLQCLICQTKSRRMVNLIHQGCTIQSPCTKTYKWRYNFSQNAYNRPGFRVLTPIYIYKHLSITTKTGLYTRERQQLLEPSNDRNHFPVPTWLNL